MNELNTKDYYKKLFKKLDKDLKSEVRELLKSKKLNLKRIEALAKTSEGTKKTLRGFAKQYLSQKDYWSLGEIFSNIEE